MVFRILFPTKKFMEFEIKEFMKNLGGKKNILFLYSLYMFLYSIILFFDFYIWQEIE